MSEDSLNALDQINSRVGHIQPEHSKLDAHVVDKHKRSQAKNSVSNSLAIRHVDSTDAKKVMFNISVVANVNHDGYDAELLKLQAIITNFLNEIHEEI